MARNFVSLLAAHADDLLILMGMITVAAGIWWVFPPLAVIVGGAFLILLGITVAQQQAKAGD